LAFCRWLRGQAVRETIWIVALTGEANLIEPAFTRASDVLLKPIDRADVAPESS
jgi:hypothetical protein